MHIFWILLFLPGQEPMNVKTLQNMGIIYTERKDYVQAIDCFKQALTIEPLNTELLYQLGIAYYQNSDYQPAIQIFRNAIKIDSLCVDAYFNLGVVFVKLKNYDSTEKYLEKASKLAPGDMEVLFYLGSTYLINGKYEPAKNIYTRIIGLVPSSPRAYEDRATANWKLGNEQAAKEDIKIAKKLHSGKPVELVGLPKTPAPSLKEQIGRATEIAIEDTITADPADRELLPYIGEIYMTTGDYELAVVAFSKAIKLAPDDPKGYEGRASAYKNLKLTEKANRDSAKAKELRKKPKR